MRHVVLLAVLAALAVPASIQTSVPARAEPALKGWNGPKPKTPCRCRHAEGKADPGEKICRIRNGRMVTLRCDLVLNNTNWTEIGEGCDVAAGIPRAVPEPPQDHATLR